MRIESISLFIQNDSTDADTVPPRISAPEDVITMYVPRLRDPEQARFYMLLLNNGWFVIGEVLVSQGIANARLVQPREVFREANRKGTTSVILLHNHPSGVNEKMVLAFHRKFLEIATSRSVSHLLEEAWSSRRFSGRQAEHGRSRVHQPVRVNRRAA